MKRTSLSPMDILGITLGVIVIVMVVGSVAAIISTRMFDSGWSASDGRFFWNEESSAGGAVKVEKDEELPSGTWSSVELRTVAGDIDVAASATGAVTVHSTRSAPSEAALANVTVDIHTVGSRLVVEEKHAPNFLRSSGTVALRVTLPAGVTVIEAHSVSGDVGVRGMAAGTDETLSTVSGSVITDAARDLDASSTSGDVTFSAAGSVAARTVSGSIDGTLTALPGSGSVRVSSVSGSITLAAFAGLDASVSLHSVSGSVSCDFPVTIAEQKRTSLKGTIGRGGAALDAGTVSGSITITKK